MDELITWTLTREEALALLAGASVTSITYDLMQHEGHLPPVFAVIMAGAIENAAASFERHRQNVNMEEFINRLTSLIPGWCIDA